MTANSFICFILPRSLYMVGHELPRSLALHSVPIRPESANTLMKDWTLTMAKFLVGFCRSYFCGRTPYSTWGLTAVSQQLKAGDMNPHIMIILKYSFYYIYEPGFSPNLTRAYSTKVGSLTERTFCKEKIILG